MAGDFKSREDVALAAVALASLLRSADAQVPLYERALGIWRAELHQGKDDAKLTAKVALMYRDISTAWANDGHFAEALESAAKARDLDAELLRRDPSSPQAQMNLAFDLMAMGDAYADMENPAAARPYLQQSVALRERVVAGNPDDRRASERLAYAVYALAKCDQDRGAGLEARRGYEKAVGIYERLSKKGPLVSQSVLKFAWSSYWLGRIETKAGKLSEGCRNFRRAEELIEEYNTREPRAPAITPEIRSAANGCPP
jgi:tetratricopeptide (TPR) repeat protein